MEEMNNILVHLIWKGNKSIIIKRVKKNITDYLFDKNNY